MCRCWAMAWLQAGVWLRHQVGRSGLSLAAPAQKFWEGGFWSGVYLEEGQCPLLRGALRVGTHCHWCAMAVVTSLAQSVQCEQWGFIPGVYSTRGFHAMLPLVLVLV